MKPHLVIVCGIILPNPSPTGQCALRYASVLKEAFEIEFVSLSSSGKEEVVVCEGITIHTLSSIRLSLENKARGLLRRFVHLIGACQLKLFLLGNLGWFSKAVYRRLEKVHSQRPIDVILTVCSPFQAHLAGAKFKEKHPEIRFCQYTVDPFASKGRIIPFFRSFDDFVKLESKISSKADCLFLSEEAFNSRQDLYGSVKNVLTLPYLLPPSEDHFGGRYDKEHIHFVYAGRFYRDFRNPDYMLRVFSTLDDDRIVLHLYSSGCEDIVKHYSETCPRIVANGYVTQDELKEFYSSCDFLVGVGNAMTDFLPSKTYEYLSLRRPIVFFNPKGFRNLVIERYPHSLQMSDDFPIGIAVSHLRDFINREKGNTISEQQLKAIYPENTSDHIRDILLQGIYGDN